MSYALSVCQQNLRLNAKHMGGFGKWYMANECIVWYCVRLDAQANLDGRRWLHNMYDKNIFRYMHSHIKLQPLSYAVSNITHTSACHHWPLLKLAGKKKMATIVYVNKTDIVKTSVHSPAPSMNSVRCAGAECERLPLRKEKGRKEMHRALKHQERSM